MRHPRDENEAGRARLTIWLICVVTFGTFLPASRLVAQSPDRRLIATVEEKVTKVDGLERRYQVLVPAREKQKMPLVFVLHGGGLGGSGARKMIRYTDMNALARKERFIVVYPSGIDGNWNDGRGATSIRAQQENIDDVKFIRTIVAELAEQYPVDTSRVFSTGISNGAFMSHRLAAEAADLVTAVAPVVGGMAPAIGASFRPRHPVSLLLIQGDADPLCPINGGQVRAGLGRDRGSLLPTKTTVAKYVKHLGIKGRPRVSMLPDTAPDDGTVTERTVYPTAPSGARVHVLVVQNGGHTWPGKPLYLPEKMIGKASRDFDATETIWEFFKSCPPREMKSRQ